MTMKVIRTGLASLLAGTDIQIIGEAANGKDALRLAQKDKPDVVLLDIRMPDGDGLSTLEKLRAKVPECKVVMLSTYDNPTYIARAVALGANDYVLKGSPREDIIATIVAAAAGESPSRSGELKKIASTMKVRQAIDDDDVPLTSARDAGAPTRGPGAKQQGDRQVRWRSASRRSRNTCRTSCGRSPSATAPKPPCGAVRKGLV